MDTISYGGWKRCLVLKNRAVELVVITDVGPRVIRFGFIGGQNLFKEFRQDRGKTGGRKWRAYGGHRLWHAPEAFPRTYFPDNAPVPYEWNGKTLTLRQETETTKGIRKEMKISLNQKKNHAAILHRLINTNPWDIEAAPWCLTVMREGGRAIFPQEPYRPHPEYLLPARPLVLWHYTDMKDPRWIWGTKYIQLRQDPNARTKQKIGMRNTPGWAAYHVNGEVFLKRFAFDPAAVYPDFGCNAEVYTDPDMLEMESLGPYTKIPADGGYVEHVEHWYLFKKDLAEEEESLDKNLFPLIERMKGEE